MNDKCSLLHFDLLFFDFCFAVLRNYLAESAHLVYHFVVLTLVPMVLFLIHDLVEVFFLRTIPIVLIVSTHILIDIFGCSFNLLQRFEVVDLLLVVVNTLHILHHLTLEIVLVLVFPLAFPGVTNRIHVISLLVCLLYLLLYLLQPPHVFALRIVEPLCLLFLILLSYQVRIVFVFSQILRTLVPTFRLLHFGSFYL